MKPDIKFNFGRFHRILCTLVFGASAAVLFAISATDALGAIFETNQNSNTVGEYHATNGMVVNASLITGLNGPNGIATDGTNLFVASFFSNTIGEYTTSGMALNTSLITGLNGPQGMAFLGPNIFVANQSSGTIGVYNATTGTPVNASFITGLGQPWGVATDGTYLYVVNNNTNGSGNGVIGKYDAITGAPVNLSLVTGLSFPCGITLMGGNLFVANGALAGTGNGTVGKYNATTGTPVNASFITGLSEPQGITTDGTNLFVVNLSTGTIGEYNATTGAAVNASLVTGLNTPVQLVLAPEACTPPPPGLVSWWPGDGNANDIQDGNSGTLQNGVTFTSGKVGRAFHFNGSNQFVTTTNNANLSFERTDAFSIDAWVRTTETALNKWIVSKRDPNANSRGYLFGMSNGQAPRCEVMNPTPTGAGALTFSIDGSVTATCPRDHALGVRGTIAINDGQWHHVAVTYDGSSSISGIKLYVDGTLDASLAQYDTLGTNSVADSAPLLIGAAENGLQPWSGDIDEVEVFNRALTQSQIQGIVNAGSAGKCRACTPPPSGMVSWWPGDGNGNDIQDGNNGTLEGNITFVAGKVGQVFRSQSPGGDELIGNPANLRLQDFTFDSWIKLNPATLTGTGPFVISYGSGGYGFGVAGPSQPPRVKGELFLTQVGSSNAGPGPSMVINDTDWHHIAVTKSGGTVSFYLDGVPSAPQSYNPAFTFSTNAAIAGSDQSDPVLYDEIEVFNRALTQSEIQAIANAGSAGKCRSCTPPPANMAAWYPGEGNATDIQNGNNGTLQGVVTYASGEVGQAFNLDGSSGYVSIPPNSSADLGASPNGLTVDTWIYPTDADVNPVVEWSTGMTYGPHLWHNYNITGNLSPGALYANIVDTSDGQHRLSTQNGVAPLNVWSHVALTYDKTTGNAAIYVNGVAAQTANLGIFTPRTNLQLNMGARPVTDGGCTGSGCFFGGRLDEVELFSRALSQSEIQAIVNAGNAGKCRTPQAPPRIISITRVGNDIVLQCLGAPSTTYTIQFSPDLVTQFSFLATRTANATGAFSLTDMNAVSLGKRFYRVTFP